MFVPAVGWTWEPGATFLPRALAEIRVGPRWSLLTHRPLGMQAKLQEGATS